MDLKNSAFFIFYFNVFAFLSQSYFTMRPHSGRRALPHMHAVDICKYTQVKKKKKSDCTSVNNKKGDHTLANI